MSGPRGEGGRRDARPDGARSSHPDPRHRGWSLPGCLRSGGPAGSRQRTAHSGQRENSQQSAEGGEGGAEGGRQKKKDGLRLSYLTSYLPSHTLSKAGSAETGAFAVQRSSGVSHGPWGAPDSQGRPRLAGSC
jgi:hypothetical protein